MLTKRKESREKHSMRGEYGKTLVELGKTNSKIVVLDADVSTSTQTKVFAKEYPDRFFNMGIAEQDMIATAVGLTTTGKIPFVSAFAIFATGRAWDQVRNSVAYPKFNVKIVATHGGITVGEDGASHQALEDISLMRSIPGMIVIVPADSKECEEAVKFAAEYNGPVYIRITRNNVYDIYGDEYKFNLNKAIVMQAGGDITLISNGETMIETLEAGEILRERGINAEVISVPVVKPLDSETIINSARKTGSVVVIENHSIIGGLGSGVCETLSENLPTKVLRIGTRDTFGQSGEQRALMEYYGLTAEKIAARVLEFSGKGINKELD